MNAILDTPVNCGRRHLLETKTFDHARSSSQSNVLSLQSAPSKWAPTRIWCSAKFMKSQAESKASLFAGSWRTTNELSNEKHQRIQATNGQEDDWHPKGDHDPVTLEFTLHKGQCRAQSSNVFVC